jgi:hypothetical protein
MRRRSCWLKCGYWRNHFGKHRERKIPNKGVRQDRKCETEKNIVVLEKRRYLDCVPDGSYVYTIRHNPEPGSPSPS